MAKLASQHIVESPALSQDGNDPNDLHMQHEEALSRYNNAKTRLTQISSKDSNQQEHIPVTVGGKSLGIATLRQRHLESHLENLRLQKQYRNLLVISRYSEEAEEIAHEENVFDFSDPTARTPTHAKDSDQQIVLAATRRQLETLKESARFGTTNLELALVKARQKLKLEQTLLERVKVLSREDHNGEMGSRAMLAKQRAMEATRDELQRWIGESLARCEQEVTPLYGVDIPDAQASDPEEVEEDEDALIETEYERYLDARLRLTQAAKALRAPLLEPTLDSPQTAIPKPPLEQVLVVEEQKQRFPLQRAPYLRHKSRISVNITKLGEQSGGAGLTRIESIHLPKYHHERLLNTHMSHLDSQTTSQNFRLLQSLGLLSHESHLLPSYPLPTLENSHRDHGREMSQQQTEIDHLLHAWAFASDTADEVLRENIMGNMEDTKEALERASQHLNEIHIMEDMRKRVATGTK